MLTQASQVVFFQVKAIKQRAIGNGVWDDVVVGSMTLLVISQRRRRPAHINRIVPCEEKHTKTVDVGLIVWRRVYAMDRGLEEVTRQSLQSVADVDRDGLVLRLDPFPLLLRVQDLQSSDRLAEEKRDAAQVCVTGRVELADLLVQIGRAGCVVHVAEVVFAFDIVLMVSDELVLVGQFENDGKESKELDDYLIVALPAESFDFFDVIVQDRRLCTLVVAIEFG